MIIEPKIKTLTRFAPKTDSWILQMESRRMTIDSNSFQWSKEEVEYDCYCELLSPKKKKNLWLSWILGKDSMDTLGIKKAQSAIISNKPI